MTVDWSISLGTIVNIIAFLVTLIALHHANIKRLAELETKVDAMWEWFARKLEGINGR